jgi:hypothetical protein
MLRADELHPAGFTLNHTTFFPQNQYRFSIFIYFTEKWIKLDCEDKQFALREI